MTSQQEAKLREVLKNVVSMIQKLRSQKPNEQDTKSDLIDPVLEALEWNIHDADEVAHEYRYKPDYDPADYALMARGQAKIFVEAKRLGMNLKTGRRELLGDASEGGTRWCILTDGDNYRVYNAEHHGGAEEKLFFEVRISDGKDDAVKYLSLLARSNMVGEPPNIDIEWEKYSVAKRVKTALQAMLNSVGPVDQVHEGLIRLIRHTCPDLMPTAITASLVRLEVRDRGEVNVAQRPADSLPQKVAGEPDQPTKPLHGAMAAFCDLFSNRDTITRSELVEKMMAQGCSPFTIKNYIAYAKRIKKGTPGIDAVSNPFPFLLEEIKDERGNKILRKVE